MNNTSWSVRDAGIGFALTTYSTGADENFAYNNLSFEDRWPRARGEDTDDRFNSWNLGVEDPGLVSLVVGSPEFLALGPDGAAVDAGMDVGWCLGMARRIWGRCRWGIGCRSCRRRLLSGVAWSGDLRRRCRSSGARGALGRTRSNPRDDHCRGRDSVTMSRTKTGVRSGLDASSDADPIGPTPEF